ncbi:hypothetical protein GCM10009584_18970 [Ornithinimicrobium humiphilum]|uniref:ATP/GTP-binding protein n=1 Tax=Ornithinimicrobium humiphilum TaxID=125288 RepID=A0A543KLM1_9MICO|nr:hypothetical protein [Ornithinimicrobium humiphilum]TQM95985.1 hypothetical protein FB476_0838 [Ornithinimicrobium humiphilum]
MGRSNRPRRSGRPVRGKGASGGPPPLRRDPGAPVEVRWAGQVWAARQVRPNDTGRVYRCPGCQGEVGADVAHTVVWPADAMHQVDNRRHWHTVCWAARERRRPGGSWA